MSKELESLRRIENYQVVVDIEKDKTATIKELLPSSCRIIENALNDNHFYHRMLDRICGFLGLDISSHRDLVETENEILNTIVENEKKLKVLEIIKKKPIVALVDYKYTYEEWLELVDEKDRDLFKNKEEYDLLKEVLL